MSNNFRQLPRPYQLAVLLGGRVEVYLEDEKEWLTYTGVTGIDREMPIRLAGDDQSIMEMVKAAIDAQFQIVEYKGYDYMLPKNALKPGTITSMAYFLGEYAQTQEDGTLKQIDNEVAKQLLEERGEPPYYSMSKKVFWAEKEETKKKNKP
jgi:hypothetical protein